MAEKKDTMVRNTPSKKKASKGDSYVCEVCGLSVIVDTSVRLLSQNTLELPREDVIPLSEWVKTSHCKY